MIVEVLLHPFPSKRLTMRAGLTGHEFYHCFKDLKRAMNFA